MYRKNKKQLIKTQKTKFYLLMATAIVLLGFLIFKDFGILQKRILQKEIKTHDETIDSLLKEINLAEQEIEKLNNDQDYIEIIARRDKFFAKPGERIYRIKEIKNPK